MRLLELCSLDLSSKNLELSVVADLQLHLFALLLLQLHLQVLDLLLLLSILGSLFFSKPMLLQL